MRSFQARIIFKGYRGEAPVKIPPQGHPHAEKRSLAAGLYFTSFFLLWGMR